MTIHASTSFAAQRTSDDDRIQKSRPGMWLFHSVHCSPGCLLAKRLDHGGRCHFLIYSIRYPSSVTAHQMQTEDLAGVEKRPQQPAANFYGSEFARHVIQGIGTWGAGEQTRDSDQIVPGIFPCPTRLGIQASFDKIEH